MGEMIRNSLRPSTITNSILERLHQRAGYEDDDISEVIAQLYIHHGFDRSGRGERVLNNHVSQASPRDGRSQSSTKASQRRRKRGSRGTKKRQGPPSVASSPSMCTTPLLTPQTSTATLPECDDIRPTTQSGVAY